MPRKKSESSSKSAKKTAPKKKTTAQQEKKSTRATTRKASVVSPATKANVASVSTQEILRNPRLWIGVAVVVLAVLLYVGKGLFVAAIINGQPISRIAVIQQLEKQNGKQVISSMISQALIMQEAKNRHLTVSQKEIDDQTKTIEDSLKAQGVTLDQALAARGMTKNDLQQQIILQALVEKMVGSQVKVSDQDVQDYIDKNQDTLPTDLSDDQLKQQVRQQLEQQQLQDKEQTFLDALQKKAKISYFVNY